MSARQPWLFCLSTMFGTALTLSACSSDDEPPVGGVGSGSMSGGVTSSNNSSSSSGTDDDTGSLTAGDGDSAGDGDGETGNITAGDGDAGTGNLTAGDGDGDGTGGSSFQQCNEFVSAGDDCGLLEADLAPLLGSCEASFEIGLVEQGDCITALLDYWQCRSELTCSDFFFMDSGSDVCMEAHAPDTACDDDSWQL